MHTTATAMASRYLVVTTAEGSMSAFGGKADIEAKLLTKDEATTSTGAAHALGRIAIDSLAVCGHPGRVATVLNADLSSQPTNATRV
jgi:hypothetical protein